MEIHEPFFVPDTLYSGVARVLACRGQCRISLYCERPSIGAMPDEQIIVAHLVTARVVAEEMARAVLCECSHCGRISGTA